MPGHFFKDFRTGRDTQAAETTSAGEAAPFCTFGNNSSCSGKENTPLGTQQAILLSRIQVLQLLQHESSTDEASSLYHISIPETALSQKE